MRFFLLFSFTVYVAVCQAQTSTQIQYLSGLDNNSNVHWDFYCTNGNNAGKWAKIIVPSNWELQGFGKYDYGTTPDSARGKEKGLYKYNFHVPQNWKGNKINIVFEGVMTDAEVKINGKSAGTIHQGAFYLFKYDISQLVNFNDSNLLEVTVSKESTNKSVNLAERHADYWIFGGIYRPVYLESLPQTHINTIAINGEASGKLTSRINFYGEADNLKVQVFDNTRKLVAETQHKLKPGGNAIDCVSKTIDPKLWTSETPYLYTATFSLISKGKIKHQVTKKFGFRTIEVRKQDGIYINGTKIKFKGLGRHSFYPTSGRTTSLAISIKDVLLLKEMNANAVRMSHYPPDQHFLDACDSLGLYVIDELAGWQKKYDSEVGSKLVKEMLEADVNHPSIVLWANGNEGGHNFDLDSLFHKYDLQQRTVIHPWYLFGGIETQHYREYNYGIASYNYGNSILMPTEFLHGLYDGGGGAGLDDYWTSMWNNPRSAGGFLWAFADEGIVRSDKGGIIDTEGDKAPDGVVGPYREKEGSFFAIKEIWSPLQIEKKILTEDFDGIINIENRFHFINSNKCSFTWTLRSFSDNKTISGKINAPNIAPLNKGHLQVTLPTNWHTFDALFITAYDHIKKELFTWSFPISSPASIVVKELNRNTADAGKPGITEIDSIYYVTVKNLKLSFTKGGLLKKIATPLGEIPFNNGPIIIDAEKINPPIEYIFNNDTLVLKQISRDNKATTIEWRIFPNGWIQLIASYFPDKFYSNYSGLSFSLPESSMRSVTLMGDGPFRVWKNRMKGTTFGIWKKEYNNTETGESWNYPEFKGYYSNLYWCDFFLSKQRFRVMTDNENIFLRLFRPHDYTGYYRFNYKMNFPAGDISFLYSIPAIGNKFNKAEDTGPQGKQNIYNNTEFVDARKLRMNLYFNFLQ